MSSPLVAPNVPRARPGSSVLLHTTTPRLIFPRIRCSPWSDFSVLGLPSMAFTFDLDLSSGASKAGSRQEHGLDGHPAGQTPTRDWRDDQMCISVQEDEDSTSHGHEIQAWSGTWATCKPHARAPSCVTLSRISVQIIANSLDSLVP